MPSLNSAIVFAYPRNYPINGMSRVTVRGASTVVTEATDNDYNSFTTQTDLDVDISDANGDPTTVNGFFVKSTGVGTHQGDPTGGTGIGWAARAIPTTVERFDGEDIPTTVLGFQHDLFLLPTPFTATSVRLRFTGTAVKIYDVMLLNSQLEWNPNKRDVVNVVPEYVRQPGRVVSTPAGRIYKIPAYANARRKWEIGYSLKVGTRRTFTDASTLLAGLTRNRNCAFVQEFGRYPNRCFIATIRTNDFSVDMERASKLADDRLDFQIVEQDELRVVDN